MDGKGRGFWVFTPQREDGVSLAANRTGDVFKGFGPLQADLRRLPRGHLFEEQLCLYER